MYRICGPSVKTYGCPDPVWKPAIHIFVPMCLDVQLSGPYSLGGARKRLGGVIPVSVTKKLSEEKQVWQY